MGGSTRRDRLQGLCKALLLPQPNHGLESDSPTSAAAKTGPMQYVDVSTVYNVYDSVYDEYDCSGIRHVGRRE